MAAGFSRNRVNVWGSAGGEAGGNNRLRVVRGDGREEQYSFVSDLAIGPEDEVVIETANGGGWGDKSQDLPNCLFPAGTTNQQLQELGIIKRDRA